MVGLKEASDWVIKVIQSCENMEHVVTCKRLIENFNVLYESPILYEYFYLLLKIKSKFLQE